LSMVKKKESIGMQAIEFWKMNGSGNDFVLVDNRDETITDDQMGYLVERICRRRESVGADGLIFIANSDTSDFAWRFFNADGSEVEMCGNGSRCVARFACLMGIAGPSMTIDTMAGQISADVSGRMVKVLMPKPSDFKRDINLPVKTGWISSDFINTGVPHVAVQVEDLREHPVFEHGKEIRYHSMFVPEGTNGNFYKVLEPDLMEVRTYERGVEDETLACGTGSIACVLVANIRGLVSSPVRVVTRGGEELKIHFKRQGDVFEEVWLEGGTSIVYQARLHKEAL